MKTLARRDFHLLGAGAVGALFPWTRNVRAAGPERKLLLFYTPHGTVWNQWRPIGGETDFQWSPILEPLAKHRERVIMVEGVSVPFGTSYYVPHTYTMPTLWTGSPIDTKSTLFSRSDHMQSFGWGTGVSIDQTIATRLNVKTPYKTLELGTYCGGLHPSSRMIYSAPGMPKSPIDDPKRAFDTVFASFTVPNNAAAAAARMARRKSVLDTVVADLKSHQAKLGAADQARLDAHATGIREIETRLQAESMRPTCTKPSAPTGISEQTAMDRQIDQAATALGCGLSRIVSLQMRVADNDGSLYPWVGIDASSAGHHNVSHDSSAPAQAKLAKLYTWYSQRFAYLLDRLAATPDPVGGSVLDNTLVIWASEIGAGWTHEWRSVPVVLAGGPSVIRGGRSLKFPMLQQSNHRLLVLAAHAMGLTEMTTYGSSDKGSGPLPGILPG